MTEDKRPKQTWLAQPDLATLKQVLSVSAIRNLAHEVITRLNERDTHDWTAPQNEVRKLTHLLCAKYPFAANRMIDQLIDAGVPVERVYQNYLAEAARQLGTRWQRNEVSFEEVGLATTRIYIILDALRRKSPPPIATQSPKIAFAAIPGEKHVLGVKMAVDVFRREGWDVVHLIDLDHDQIVKAAQDVDIVLVGLSASGRRTRAALLRLVVALRVARPDLKILLSGEIAKSEPDFLSQVGIDAVVKDVETALEVVQRLLKNVPKPRKMGR
ncbi:cobalamin B12-binding domain-containing protein [Aestuariivita boseongensis]|uniref:cobalamin B12-binding domain-containing protein n=1 Tax=Aestuariivita boseongensis TaxID=1470562 RepID=UPI0006806954|nr:cobalamin B12-binding domain-containing protein [Aestuariivita boseongensis]